MTREERHQGNSLPAVTDISIWQANTCGALRLCQCLSLHLSLCLLLTRMEQALTMISFLILEDITGVQITDHPGIA